MTRHRVHEILLGLLGVSWGTWMVVFNSYDSSPVLTALRAWDIAESLLVLIPALAGIGLWIFPTGVRRHIHLLMCSFWCFISVAVANNNLALTAIPVYAIVGILHACSGLMTGRLR